MAVQRGQVQVNIRITGADESTKALRSAEAGLDRLAGKGSRAGQSINIGLVQQAQQGFLGLGKGVTAAAAKFSLLTMAAEQAGQLVVGALDFASTGAAAADQLDVISRQVGNIGEVVERTKKSTTNLIPEAQIIRSAALFRSFGLDVQQIDRVLAEAAKTATRTGEDIGFLVDSLIKGVARESPAILDNLGITVSLADAKARAAEESGKLAEALTGTETKAALLSNVLDKLASQNKDVDLTKSRTAAIQRLKTAWEDYSTTLSGFLATNAVSVIDWLTGADEHLSLLDRNLRQVRDEMPAFLRDVEIRAREGMDALGMVANRTIEDYRRLFNLSHQASRTLTLPTVDRLRAAEAAAGEAAGKDFDLRALDRRKTITRLTQQGLLDEAAAAKKLADIEKDRGEFIKARMAAARDSEFEAIKAADVAAKAQAEADAEALRRIGELEDRRLEIQGVDIAQRQLRTKQRELDAAVTAGDLRKQVELLTEVVNLEAAVAHERKKAKKTKAASGPEGVSPADEVRLARALAAAEGEVTAEVERQLAHKEHATELARINLDLAAGKITKAKALLEVDVASANLAARKLAITQSEVRATEAKLRAAERLKLGLRGTLGIPEVDPLSSDKTTDDLLRAAAASKGGLQNVGAGPSLQVGGFDGVLLGGSADRAAANLSLAVEAGVITAEEAATRLDEIVSEARQERVSSFFAGIGDAATMAAESMDPVVSALGRMVHALEDNANALASGGDASIAAIGKVAAAVVDNEKAKAIILAATETAAGFASLGAHDYTGAAMHFLSAGLYGAVAGTSTGKSGGTSTSASPSSFTPPEQRASQSTSDRDKTVIVNINAPVVGGTAQEIGAQLQGFIAEAAGTGMGAAA